MKDSEKVIGKVIKDIDVNAVKHGYFILKDKEGKLQEKRNLDKFSFQELVSAFNFNINSVSEMKMYNEHERDIIYKVREALENDKELNTKIYKILKEEIIKRIVVEEIMFPKIKGIDIALSTSSKTVCAGLSYGSIFKLKQGDEIRICWKSNDTDYELEGCLINVEDYNFSSKDNLISKDKMVDKIMLNISDTAKGEKSIIINNIRDERYALVIRAYNKNSKVLYNGGNKVKLKIKIVGTNIRIFETKEFELPYLETSIGLITKDKLMFNMIEVENSLLGSLKKLYMKTNLKFLRYSKVIEWLMEAEVHLDTLNRQIINYNLATIDLKAYSLKRYEIFNK